MPHKTPCCLECFQQHSQYILQCMSVKVKDRAVSQPSPESTALTPLSMRSYYAKPAAIQQLQCIPISLHSISLPRF